MKGLSFTHLAVCLAIAVSPATALPQPTSAGMVINDNSVAYRHEGATGVADNGAVPSGPPYDEGSPITCSNLPLAQQETCHSPAVGQDSRDDRSGDEAVLPGDTPCDSLPATTPLPHIPATPGRLRRCSAHLDCP